MAIQTLNVGSGPGAGDGEGLRSSQVKVNSNFAVAENAASKIVQASSADTTADKVMLSDYAWRGAQLGDYFTYGGTANAITLTSANLKAGGTLIAGMKFRFKATATNTGATTIAVDGGTATACVTPTGVALPAGFIRTDVITECEYDGANFVVSRKIESGSNANGEWTKWENGRMEQEGSGTVVCSNPVSDLFGSTAGNVFYGDEVITFPTAFSSFSFASAATASSISSLSVVDRNPTVTGFEPRVWAQLTGTSFDLVWSAKGKWY